MESRHIPDATVGRLPLYLRVLLELGSAGQTTVSSEQLADLSGVNAAKVRKDLSQLGSYGTRGVGYDDDYLRYEISTALGLAEESSVAVVGMGNLGMALVRHGGFRERGFPVVAAYDVDPDKVGAEVDGLVIAHVDDLGSRGTPQATIGVITTPPGVAQQVADRLVEAGIMAILNFAPAFVTVPEGVTLRKVDLTLELQVLNFYQQRQGSAPPLPMESA
jgi:redox-sensing transcriptional repressor